MLLAQIAGVDIEMEIDTGVAVYSVSETTWKECLPHVKLEPSKQNLSTYTGQRIRVMGKVIVPLRCNGQTAQVSLVVVPGEETPLFGRNWLNVVRLDWPEIKGMENNTSVEIFLKKYAKVFRNELGTLKKYKAHIKEGATTRFLKSRQVPFALKSVIDKEL